MVWNSEQYKNAEIKFNHTKTNEQKWFLRPIQVFKKKIKKFLAIS